MEKTGNKLRHVIDKYTEGLRRLGIARLGWYAALAALLVMLGTASWSYRHRRVATEAQEPAPREVMAVTTPDPLAALVALPSGTPSPTQEPLWFVWPVEGEIIGEYAADHMVYSDEMGQWQTHPAVDIAAAAGEAVAACADGVVADAWEDPIWGNVVRIEHPEEYVSTYANLSTLKLVTVGDGVSAGQIIGAVGRTAACESDMPWHLHFSLEKGKIALDFEEIMAKKQK